MKVMTYNVHSCIDPEGRNSLVRVAELIRREKPSVVGLNEVENFSPRSRFANQPKRLAAAADMLFSFGPTLRLGPVGFFGNAVLSHYPIRNCENIRLPGGREPRCCLRAVIDTPHGPITVLCTHLGLNGREQTVQIATLGEIVNRERQPVILMGDFNCKNEQLSPLYERLKDLGAEFGSPATFPAWRPSHRIDYILVSREIGCTALYSLASDASDHLPVMAELVLPP